MDSIPGWVGDSLTPWGLLLIVVVMILTGRLVPRVYFLEVKQDRDLQKATNESLATAVTSISEAIPDILEVAETTHKIMTEVKVKADEWDKPSSQRGGSS